MPSLGTGILRGFRSAFGDFGGRVWLNAAHQGPLPRVAVEAAEEALAAKAAPYLIDDEAFGRFGVHLVANVTQGLGALPLDLSALPLAAISCSGFKWLCGPYATGFAWIRPDVLETMRPVQAYWLALPDGVELDLNREGEHRLRDDLAARAYDVFGTANFLNFIPWAAALEYLLARGIEAIAGHDQALVERLIGLLHD